MRKVTLREARIKAGLSQIEISQILGINQTFYSVAERAEIITFTQSVKEKIIKILDISEKEIDFETPVFMSLPKKKDKL